MSVAEGNALPDSSFGCLCQAEVGARLGPARSTVVKATRVHEASPYPAVDAFIQDMASGDDTPGGRMAANEWMRELSSSRGTSLLFDWHRSALHACDTATPRLTLPLFDVFLMRRSLLLPPPARLRNWSLFAERGVLVFNIDDNRYCERIGRQHKSNNGQAPPWSLLQRTCARQHNLRS